MKLFGFNLTPLAGLTVLRAFLYSLIATGGALKIALSAKPWGERAGSDQTILVLELLGVQSGIMLAFIDKTIADLATKTPQPPKGPPTP